MTHPHSSAVLAAGAWFGLVLPVTLAVVPPVDAASRRRSSFPVDPPTSLRSGSTVRPRRRMPARPPRATRKTLSTTRCAQSTLHSGLQRSAEAGGMSVLSHRKARPFFECLI